MIIYLINNHTLKVEDFYFQCVIGKNGTSNKKIEGDKKTPKGTYRLGDLYYRKDRNVEPETKLKCIEIKKNMGWCNDLKNKKKYNRLIKKNEKIKHEKLFRADHLYDFFIPIKYNSDKIILGKGSCIFLHLTHNFKPTAGCIALKKQDFLILLKLLKKNTKIKI
tara:strand:- start:7876 stop:8367 length:492 start_codon:yes stop_codon:yes gene_type:complete